MLGKILWCILVAAVAARPQGYGSSRPPGGRHPPRPQGLGPPPFSAPGGISGSQPSPPSRPFSSGIPPGSAPAGISGSQPSAPSRPSGFPPAFSAPGGISGSQPPPPQRPSGFGPPPGSAPGGISSSRPPLPALSRPPGGRHPPRPQRPQRPLGTASPPPGSAPGGISGSQPPPPQRPSGFGPPPGSAPGGISSSRPPLPALSRPPGGSHPPRPQRPQRPLGTASPPPGSAPGGISGIQPSPPQRPQDIIPILVDERQGPNADGSYSFNFETGNGISRQEQGYPVGDTGAVAQQGQWSFTFPDGTPAVFNFIADENGFRVESDLLPTPPPLPAHAIAQIEKARQENNASPSASGTSGSYNPPPTAPPFAHHRPAYPEATGTAYGRR